ncbi:unnamed protein product [Lactuca saligna]|uniref:Mitochondrial-processing peptidase subunit alpha n=1 Tax=Lactuca saligna TaxID=75948 RepID=A0AA36EN13_LACSI|nr:unnamed protein product [Lactuca saligna]
MDYDFFHASAISPAYNYWFRTLDPSGNLGKEMSYLWPHLLKLNEFASSSAVTAKSSSGASIELYVNSSSMYETPISFGATHLLERMAFKSTTNRAVKAAISEYANNPETLLLEAIDSVGYSGALANPLLASEGSLNRLSSSILEEFVSEKYTAPRIVLAASGVEHEELLKYAEPLLSDLPGGVHFEEPKSVYVGVIVITYFHDTVGGTQPH